LVAHYDAFRFTESYGVIFQCNVRYCLGPCEPAVCDWGLEKYESYGKRRRRAVAEPELLGATGRSNAEDMTLSQEILVLDFGDDELGLNKTGGSRYESGPGPLNEEGIAIFETCPTRTSVLALAVTCSLLLLIYVCSLFYFLMRRWFTHKPLH
jgi:hypothetical protein